MKSCQQLDKEFRKKIENARGGGEPEPMRPLRKHHERNRDCDAAADRHLQQAIERRLDGTFAELARNQQHDRGSEGGDAKARTDRRGKSERRDGEGEDASQRELRRVGDKHRDGGGVDGTADRA